jgi:ABC-type transport system involved in multi-copper enzyme maturation permease subunit
MRAGQLLANTVTHLRFYRRNRLLVLVGLLIVILFLISIGPTAFTASKKFDTIQALVSTAEGYLILLAALVGLVTISHHLRSRSLKLVITHPCPMETWVLSHFAAALCVVSMLFMGILALALGLFAAWGVPVQWGIVYVLLQSLCSAMVIFAFLLFLSTVVHPVVAALIALIFNPDSLRWMITIIRAQMELHPDGHFMTLDPLLMTVFQGLYMVWPEYYPFAEQTARLQGSYRVAAGDGYLVFLTVLYSLLLCALSFFLTTAVLNRKRHI